MSTKAKRDNRIVVDLRKVQWARYYYRNQHSDTRDVKPSTITYYNISMSELASTEALFHPDNPGESLLDRYRRRGHFCDDWQPELCLKVTANTTLIYTGNKATSLWKAWQERIFNNGPSTKTKSPRN